MKHLSNNYYNSKKSEFLTQFEEYNKRIEKLISAKYGEKFKNTVLDKIKEEYEFIYEQIPYIGGDSNPLTFNLVSAAQHLAFYKALKKYDKPLKEIGEIAYKSEEELFTDHPELIPPMTHPKYIGFMKYAAEESEQRKYPEDWVYIFIEGNEKNDYGLDFTECGIQKFFHEQNADEFTPYLCAMDIIISKTANLGLHRTQTLAEGSDKCNFCYKAGRETKVANTVITD